MALEDKPFLQKQQVHMKQVGNVFLDKGQGLFETHLDPH